MALICYQAEGFDSYLVNPYWCNDNWFIACSDDELIIGIRIGRVDTLDKTLIARMRKLLRDLKIKGKPEGSLYRDSKVFRTSEGGKFKYKFKESGICNLMLKGPITVNLNKYLDHGQMITGLADLENQTIWNKGKEKKHARKKNH